MAKTLGLIALTVQLCSCAGSASFSSRDLGRGRMQLRGAYMPAYASARAQIAEYCDGFAIVREEASGVSFRCAAGQGQLTEVARGN